MKGTAAVSSEMLRPIEPSGFGLFDGRKRICRAVVPRCEDGGVGWAIERFVLGGEEI